MREPIESTATVTDGILHLPRADQAVREQVVLHLLERIDELSDFPDMTSDDESSAMDLRGAVDHGEAWGLIVPLLEACLEDAPDDVTPQLVAELALLTALPALPETIAVQIAFGRGAGDEQIREMARLFSRARHRGLTVDEYVAELVEADAVPRGKLVRLFHGETSRVPDPERMQRGIALLRRTASLVPPQLRPPLLCVIAWLHWARGKRAHAMAYLAEAQRIEPEHILAFGLNWLVTTKRPRWITH